VKEFFLNTSTRILLEEKILPFLHKHLTLRLVTDDRKTEHEQEMARHYTA
jgi:hypothetical protein